MRLPIYPDSPPPSATPHIPRFEASSLAQLMGGPAPTVELRHARNGVTYAVTKQTYGALSDDSDNPLSCVSVANSSLSIDMWKGCTWQCSYCHVHDAEVNHGGDGVMRMPSTPSIRTKHSAEEVIAALVEHPFFEADKTVLSIGTASTEPFDARLIDQVFEIIDELQTRGLRNPIWIVTKNGVPKRALERMSEAIKKSNQFIISLTCGGLNETIEPLQNPRFKNAEAAAAMGAKIVLYLRPILEEWGSTQEKLTSILEEAKKAIGKENFSAIAPGGLRWAEGVEIALLSHGLGWPESLSKDPDAKELPDHILEHVLREAERLFPQVPLVRHSSCALSNILKRADITLTYRRKVEECLGSTCQDEQRARCSQANGRIDDVLEKVNTRLKGMGADLEITGVDEEGKISFSPHSHESLRYGVKRTILKMVASEAANI